MFLSLSVAFHMDTNRSGLTGCCVIGDASVARQPRFSHVLRHAGRDIDQSRPSLHNSVSSCNSTTISLRQFYTGNTLYSCFSKTVLHWEYDSLYSGLSLRCRWLMCQSWPTWPFTKVNMISHSDFQSDKAETHQASVCQLSQVMVPAFKFNVDISPSSWGVCLFRFANFLEIIFWLISATRWCYTTLL